MLAVAVFAVFFFFFFFLFYVFLILPIFAGLLWLARRALPSIPAGFLWPARRTLPTIPTPAGLIWLARRALPTIRFPARTEGLFLSTLSSTKKSTDFCQIASATVAGVQTSASQFFWMLRGIFFFLKALKATEFFVAVETSLVWLRNPACSRIFKISRFRKIVAIFYF